MSIIKQILFKTKHLPLAILPCMLGAGTLSSIYSDMGFTFIKHLTMFFIMIILAAYLFKIIIHHKIAIQEYMSPSSSSLYPIIFMLFMVIGSYTYTYFPIFGKTIWFIAIIFHIIHIVLFTYLHFIKSRDINTFLPTWFVTYNGIMVSCVVGSNMNENGFLSYIVYYGIIIYIVILPIMIYRLKKVEIQDTMQHATAILLGPCSLGIVSYINIIKEPNIYLVCFLYICVILSLIYVILKLPKLLSYSFTPAFAGLTFPMAIGTVATQKVIFYFDNIGYESMSKILKQLEGVQIYLTTSIIAFVLFNFIKLFTTHFKSGRNF